jgi:glycosyltransferase involved in cell wall biosynthesis
VLLNSADRVLFTSEEEMESAHGGFYPYRLRGEVVSYGTGDAPMLTEEQGTAFRAACPSIEGRKYFLFLSRIYPKKGCDLLIKAFAKYAPDIPNIDLVIAGPDQIGWAAELKLLSENLGVAERIHWPGLLTGDAKWGAYRGAEAFVLPSHHENFGIVVAEAMACGTPLLISNKINIWRETMEDGASIVEEDDQDGTNRLFERYLATSESDRAKMGTCSRKSFLKRFHIDTVARDLVRLIEKVADEKKSPMPLGVR